MTQENNEELLRDVVTECLEHADQMETLLLSLESTADHPDPEVINSIFRSAHSIKGVTGFCGLNRIKDTAHVFESVLNAYRSGTLKPNPNAVDTLLKATDFLKTLLNDAVHSENYDIDPMVSSLNRILNGEDEGGEQDTTAVMSNIPETSQSPATLVDGTGRYFFRTDAKVLADIGRKGHQIYIVRLDFLKDLDDGAPSRDMVLDHIASLGQIVETCLAAEDGQGSVPAAVLMSSLIEPPMMAAALNVPEEEIELISDFDAGMGINTPMPAVSPAAPAAVVSEPAAPAVETQRTAAKEAPASAPESAPPDMGKIGGGHAQSSLRVNVALLDKLMNLAGELVLGRNQLLQTSSSLNISSLTPVAQRIDMITSEIQTEIMQTRMQELSFVFGKFPRLVRDLSRALNKKVELLIEGEDTELDKTIIESLNDPLVHLIRNSLDHGIETPEVRIAAGKNPVGKLEVMAYHEAGQVNIVIRDDGAGINTEKVKQKAVQMGIISASEAQVMSHQAALELIYHAGFSTAEKVSDVSGRGVGMDVVRSNLEKLGGMLDLQSTLGQGTTTRIKLPLTMAIIPCLIVRLGKDGRYAVPQINLIELVRVRSSELNEKIKKVAGAEVLRLRENLLPLVRLSEVLGTDGYYRDALSTELRLDRRKNVADRRSSESPEEAEANADRRTGKDRRESVDALNILVLSAGDMEYGLIVDELEDTEEIVVKPLGRHLKEIESYAGATIMGDGRVAPILDVPGLAQKADLHRKGEAVRKAAAAKEKRDGHRGDRDMEKVLVFNNGAQELFAVPIPLVARIERVETKHVENAMGHLSIQYRGSSLRLIRLDKHLPVSPLPEANTVYIIVFEIGGAEIGILVSNLVDEKLVHFKLDTHTHQRKGVMGSMIIDDNTVMVIDIYELVELEEPQWLTKGKKSSSGNDDRILKILLVEDSEFFTDRVSGYLRDAGMDVTTAANGRIGLEKLENGEFDIVLTDIEMPVMNGYEMVKKIRSNPKYAETRILALSSLAGDDDIQRGLDAGVDRYLIKLDKSNLIDTVMEFCNV